MMEHQSIQNSSPSRVFVYGIGQSDRTNPQNNVGRLAAQKGKKGKMNREHQHHPEDQGTDQQTLKISHLKRREIQAPIAACLEPISK